MADGEIRRDFWIELPSAAGGLVVSQSPPPGRYLSDLIEQSDRSGLADGVRRWSLVSTGR